MNTPAHMIIGSFLWARRDSPGSLIATLAGGLAPDLPMLTMVLYASVVAGIPQPEVFATLFFSEDWQRVFAVDHSLVVWSLFLGVGYLFRAVPLTAFAGSGFAHAAVDFVTHHDDARKQLWPLTDWVFRSPISYWDPAYFGNLVAPIEALIVLIMTILLMFRMVRLWERLLTIAISSILLAPIVMTGGFHGLHGMG